MRGASHKPGKVTAERQRAVTEALRDRQDKTAGFMAALIGAGEEPGTGASSSEGSQQQGMQGTETPSNGDSTWHITDYTTASRVTRGNFEKGWVKPSPIQEDSYLIALSGRDIRERDKNENGKIGAYYTLRLEQTVTTKDIIQGVIIVSTRELALQTPQIAIERSEHLGIKIVVATDNTNLKDNIMRMPGWTFLQMALISRQAR